MDPTDPPTAARSILDDLTVVENGDLRRLLSRLQQENAQLKRLQQQGEQQFLPSHPPLFAILKDSPATGGNSLTSLLQAGLLSGSSAVPFASPQTNLFTPPTSSEFHFGSVNPLNPFSSSVLDTYPPQPAPVNAMSLTLGFVGANRQPLNTATTINPLDFSMFDQWSSFGLLSGNGNSSQTFDESYRGSSDFLAPSRAIDSATRLMKPHSLTDPSFKSSADSPEKSCHLGVTGWPTAKGQPLRAVDRGGFSSFVVEGPDTSFAQCDAGSALPLENNADEDAPTVMSIEHNFPDTERNHRNVDVDSAWRVITSNPRFKVVLFYR